MFISSDDGFIWTWQSQVIFSKHIFDLTHSIDRFIAAGQSGFVYLSDDNGVSWREVSTPASVDLRSIQINSAENIIVAVGLNGVIIRSTDRGETWSTVTSNVSNNLWDLEYMGGKYFALGDNGTILYSTDDGITWINVSTGTSTLLWGAYGNGVYVLVGDNGTILRSTDGVNWSAVNSGSSTNLTVIGYLAYSKQFVAIGLNTVLKSYDGITWNIESASSLPVYNVKMTACYADGGEMIAIGEFGTIIHSTVNKAWTSRVSGIATQLNSITYGNGTFVAVGAAGGILRSFDSINWTTQTSGTTSELKAVAFGNNVFVAVGLNGTILTSRYGKTWTLANSTITTTLNSIVFANNMFVAAGSSGKTLVSIDGTNWTLYTTPLGSSISAITYLADYNNWWSFGTGNSSKSTNSDANVWNTYYLPNPPYSSSIKSNAAIAVGSKFFVASDYGSLYFSHDNGATLDSISTITDYGYNNTNIAYGGGIYYVTNNNGYISISADGYFWNVGLVDSSLRSFYGVYVPLN